MISDFNMSRIAKNLGVSRQLIHQSLQNRRPTRKMILKILNEGTNDWGLRKKIDFSLYYGHFFAAYYDALSEEDKQRIINIICNGSTKKNIDIPFEGC